MSILVIAVPSMDPGEKRETRGVIFTSARVSLAVISLRKNGDYSLSNYLFVYVQLYRCDPVISMVVPPVLVGGPNVKHLILQVATVCSAFRSFCECQC